MKICFKKEHMLGSFYSFWIIVKNYIDQYGKHGLKRRKSTDMVHCELWFDATKNKMSWGSSEEDGGTRAKKINYSHRERWTMLDVTIGFINKNYAALVNASDPRFGRKFKTEQELINFLKGMHASYDWDLIIHFVFPSYGSSSKKLVCSEALLFALGYCKQEYNDVTPMKAFDLIQDDLRAYYAKV